MANARYAHMGTPFVKLAEECAEVVQSCMKIERFGLHNFHPITKETNISMLQRELFDLKDRIKEVEEILNSSTQTYPEG